MRLYRERIPPIARSISLALIGGELIEVTDENRDEVQLDVESVLKEYRRMDYELTESAKDLVELRGLDYSQTFKLKARLASERKFGLGDEALDWITSQIIELLLQSKFVEEVWGEDHDLRRVIVPVLKKELTVGNDLDREVKKRIRNMQEGTNDYEIEYRRTMEQLKATKKLAD